MGTRNVTIVVSGGKSVVAQYGQWDGYPDGQGATALAFARDHLRVPHAREAFRDRLSRVRLCDQAEVERLWNECGSTDDERNREFRKRHPYFTRDHGAGILQLIWDAKGPVLTRDETDFVADSLMCEWAYVIDLDKQTFEVYRGFNTKPVPAGERFAGMKPHSDEPSYSGNRYYPVRLARSWSFAELPTKKAFLADPAWNDDEDEESGSPTSCSESEKNQ